MSSRTPERKQRKKEKRKEGTSPSATKWKARGQGLFKHLGLQAQRERVKVRFVYGSGHLFVSSHLGCVSVVRSQPARGGEPLCRPAPRSTSTYPVYTWATMHSVQSRAAIVLFLLYFFFYPSLRRWPAAGFGRPPSPAASRHRRLVAAVAPPHSPYSLSTRTRIASDKGGRASLDPRALYDVSLDVRLRST